MVDEFSGRDVVDEHFVPVSGASLRDVIRSGDANAVHHLIRYEWAARVLGDFGQGPLTLKVLDLATGSGYGAAELARRRANVTVLAVDYDAEAVREASRKYVLPNLEFSCGDATRWSQSIGESPFDVIVAFDMIEHVAHREIMMEELVRHLRPEGALFLSTPCGWNEPVLKPDWIHHRIEYSAASLYDFLRRYFRVVVRPEDPEFPHREVFDLLKEGPVTYLLKMNPVICREPILLENPYR